MTETARPKRPVVVTIVVVLVAIGGALSIVSGLLLLLSRYRVTDDLVLTVSLLGAGTALFGLLNIAVAAGIARGSSLARMLATMFGVLEIIVHVTTIGSTDGFDASAAIDLALSVVVVALLWLPPGSRYFRAVAPAPAAAP